MKECRLRVAAPITVTTENSVWTITPTHYRRTRVKEGTTRSLDNSLTYDVDVPYREAYLVAFGEGDTCVRLVPSDRWWGAYGIHTGPILDCQPTDIFLATDQEIVVGVAV